MLCWDPEKVIKIITCNLICTCICNIADFWLCTGRQHKKTIYGKWLEECSDRAYFKTKNVACVDRARLLCKIEMVQILYISM